MTNRPTREELENRIMALEKADYEGKQSESMLNQIFSMSLDMICIADINTATFIKVNPAFTEILGFSEKELLEKPFIDFVHPDDIASTLSVVQKKLLAGEKVINFENRYRCKDGSYRWFSWVSHPIPDKGKTYAVARDITQWKKDQKDLHESEERYKALFHNINSGAAVYKAVDDGDDFIFVDFNKAGEEIEKIKKEELLNKRVTKIFPSIKEFGLLDVFKRVWKTGKPERLPIAHYRDQRISGFRDNYIYKLPSGEIVAVYSDETEQKQAEEDLKAERDFIERLMETSPAGITRVDNHGIVVYANRRAEKIFGFQLSENGRRKYNDPDWKITAIDGTPFPVEDLPYNIVKETGEPVFGVQHGITWPNGRRVLLSINAAPLFDSSGIFEGMVAIIDDITEMKTMEENLRHAHKMESIGTLTGGIAHDFNNILGIIVGNTELALDDVPEWNPAHYNLKEIKTASLRATKIVKQLLSFTRRTDQNLQTIEIDVIVQDALKFLRSTIPTTIDIVQDIQVREETILADPSQINQILMNLCINAAQAMEQTGGKLTVNVEKVILDDHSAKDYPDLKSGSHIKITVGDTGPGIDHEIIDRIFDPYFTTREVGKGSGMGLAVVHGIVKNHNGAIFVDSKPGKGSKFTILFPVADQKPGSEKNTPGGLLPGNEAILFVDDEESIANMFQMLLKRLGYKVTTAVDPLDALEHFSADPGQFDLVITDMTMPKMTGVILSERIKEIRPDIPVIICTGHSALMDEEKAKNSNIAAYIMKPVAMKEIAKTIRTVIDGAEK